MPSTLRVTFPGHEGVSLDGRLELPDSDPVCFATFSHCFTCTKDTLAAFRISKTLASLGIATLRFDFAGLGDSAGEFAATSFSTTRDDLFGAITYLDEHHASPTILIGHSMGGTTALSCAGEVDSVRAVVTIASPSQPKHVLHHFGPALEELRNGQASSIDIAGQQYDFEPRFIEDIESHDMRDTLVHMRKPVLAFNVTGDTLVGQHNAEEIQSWTAADSTIITLENTDHLISDKLTADRVAENILDFFRAFT